MSALIVVITTDPAQGYPETRNRPPIPDIMMHDVEYYIAENVSMQMAFRERTISVVGDDPKLMRRFDRVSELE